VLPAGSLMSLTAVSSVTLLNGTGTNDPQMAFVGTVVNVNAALAMLSVQPASGYTGVISIIIVADDTSMASITETLTVAVRRSITNRAPQLFLNTSVNLTVPQDGSASLQSLGVIIGDADMQSFDHEAGAMLRSDVSVANGALYVDQMSSDVVITSIMSSSITVGPAVCPYSASPALCVESCCAVSALTMHGSRPALMSALRSMVFRPATGFVGLALLSILVSDEGCCGAGGPLTSSTAVNIYVLARKRAPMLTMASVSSPSWVVKALSDTVLALPSVSVADLDFAGGELNCTLRVSSGTVTLSSVAGLSFSVGTGSNDSVMVFRGTDSFITAATTGMIFRRCSSAQTVDTVLWIEVTNAANGVFDGGSQMARLYLLLHIQEPIASPLANLGVLDVVPPVLISSGVWNAWTGLTVVPVFDSTREAEYEFKLSAPPGTFVSLLYENGVRCTMGSINPRPGASAATVDQRFGNANVAAPFSMSCVARPEDMNRILRSLRFQRDICGPAYFNLTVLSSELFGTMSVTACFVVLC